MDGQQPNFELPPLNLGAASEQYGQGQPAKAEANREMVLTQPEQGAKGPTSAAPAIQSAQPIYDTPGSVPSGSGATQAAPSDLSLPAIADDADLIEKEWVTKAKNIVAQTRNDPRKQNHEISKFKAGYIKRRYNKDIRVSEE